MKCNRVKSDRVQSIFFGSGCCDASVPPVEEVGPSIVLDAAFDGEQGVGACFRPATPRPLEAASDDLLAGAFHDAGSDRHSSFSVEVTAHSVLVGLEIVDAGRDGFGAAAVRLQLGDNLIDLPGGQLLLEPAHPRHRSAFARRHVQICVGESQPSRRSRPICPERARFRRTPSASGRIGP